MPHTRSAKKNVRKSAKRRLVNRATKKSIKIQIRKVEETVQKGPAEQSRLEVLAAIRKLDKAAARRIIHPNLAARKKSQLAHLLNAKTGATLPAAK